MMSLFVVVALLEWGRVQMSRMDPSLVSRLEQMVLVLPWVEEQTSRLLLWLSVLPVAKRYQTLPPLMVMVLR
jgi:hypothetical protein